MLTVDRGIFFENGDPLVVLDLRIRNTDHLNFQCKSITLMTVKGVQIM